MKERSIMTVGDKIRKYRLEQGYTQKELAIKAGLSESAVRNYERGTAPLPRIN